MRDVKWLADVHSGRDGTDVRRKSITGMSQTRHAVVSEINDATRQLEYQVGSECLENDVIKRNCR